MRFIVECGTLEEAHEGLDAIKRLTAMPEHTRVGIRFTNENDWIVRETKTGYSSKATVFNIEEDT